MSRNANNDQEITSQFLASYVSITSWDFKVVFFFKGDYTISACIHVLPGNQNVPHLITYLIYCHCLVCRPWQLVQMYLWGGGLQIKSHNCESQTLTSEMQIYSDMLDSALKVKYYINSKRLFSLCASDSLLAVLQECSFFSDRSPLDAAFVYQYSVDTCTYCHPPQPKPNDLFKIQIPLKYF